MQSKVIKLEDKIQRYIKKHPILNMQDIAYIANVSKDTLLYRDNPKNIRKLCSTFEFTGEKSFQINASDAEKVIRYFELHRYDPQTHIIKKDIANELYILPKKFEFEVLQKAVEEICTESFDIIDYKGGRPFIISKKEFLRKKTDIKKRFLEKMNELS